MLEVEEANRGSMTKKQEEKEKEKLEDLKIIEYNR